MPKCKYPQIKRVFRSLREELNTIQKDCTQDELAKELGLSKPQISKLENGLREPSLTELKAYSKYFNCPIEYLLGLNNSRTYGNYATSAKIGLSDKALERLKWWTKSKSSSSKASIYMVNMLLEHDKDFYILSALYNYLFALPESFIIEKGIKEPLKESAKQNKEKMQDFIFVQNKNGGGFPITIKEVRHFIIQTIIGKLKALRQHLIDKKHDDEAPGGFFHLDTYASDMLDD